MAGQLSTQGEPAALSNYDGDPASQERLVIEVTCELGIEGGREEGRGSRRRELWEQRHG